MSNITKNRTELFFGDVISSYTRAQAIEDGVLIDAGEIAQEAGFKYSVALTSAVWSDCVAWTDDDNRNQVYQNQTCRLWDVLYFACHAIRTSSSLGNHILYQLNRVPCDGQSRTSVLVTLKLIIGPGDHGEPVNTILMPDED